MCNRADKAKQVATKGHNEQNHVIADLYARRTQGKVDRFDYTQGLAMARARRAAYAEVLEVLA